MAKKISKVQRQALNEATERGNRIWRELGESTTTPAPKPSKGEKKLAKEVGKMISKALREVRADNAALTEAAITRGKAEVTRQVLAEMDPGQFRRHAANEWDRHFEQMAAPLVPDVWKRGSLSDNQSQQSPAA